MKNKKKDIINILIIVLFVLLYVVLTTKFFSLTYGSTTDWDCQHWNIPDYFRKLFYSSHNVLNDFAANLGDGQNIYYLSYYGYLSPIVLLSFLLPFIPMKLYIEVMSILGLIVSGCLFYVWIRKKYNSKLSLLISLVFISASPMLFHSHRHIMFISYMPFLLLCFNEIDKNFELKRTTINPKIILYMFLIIMSNYFFSVSALFAISIYELYKISNIYSKKNIQNVKKEIINYVICGIIAVGMSSILILPTLAVILNGRASSNVNISLISLLLPNFKIQKVFYGAYSSGISYFTFLVAILNLKNKEYRNLSIILIVSLLFPLVCFLLNGTMYIDNKVFIPRGNQLNKSGQPMKPVLVNTPRYSFNIKETN